MAGQRVASRGLKKQSLVRYERNMSTVHRFAATAGRPNRAQASQASQAGGLQRRADARRPFGWHAAIYRRWARAVNGRWRVDSADGAEGAERSAWIATGGKQACADVPWEVGGATLQVLRWEHNLAAAGWWKEKTGVAGGRCAMTLVFGPDATVCQAAAANSAGRRVDETTRKVGPAEGRRGTVVKVRGWTETNDDSHSAGRRQHCNPNTPTATALPAHDESQVPRVLSGCLYCTMYVQCVRADAETRCVLGLYCTAPCKVTTHGHGRRRHPMSRRARLA